VRVDIRVHTAQPAHKGCMQHSAARGDERLR
jgi:hypothetical protein